MSAEDQTTPPHATQAPLGLWSGVGLVVANMIGAGVFLSAGFMAQDLAPHWILLAWLVGAGLAMAGARAYAAVALALPRSGGEYRYLSELLHPAAGYLAGWTSLLVGFSAPIAVDALAAAAFAQTLGLAVPAKLLAAAVIVVLTAAHATGMGVSVRTQNVLVAVKATLVGGFVALGLLWGHNHWPVWEPAHHTAGFPLAAFAASLFYVAFAFSGWNASAYVAEEFRSPARDVPRSMLLGCALVAVFYLLVNWVFVANLTPESATAVFRYDTARLTLGHLVTRDLLGEAGARVMSLVVIIAFLSATSAMTFVGPRVYAAMARDGFLPRALAGRLGRPPAWAVLLQGAIALLLVFAYRLQQILQNMGAILTLFSALTALSLLRLSFGHRIGLRPSRVSLVAACLYALSAAWLLYFGFRSSPSLLLWVAVLNVAGIAAYLATRRTASRSSSPPSAASIPSPR
jgi:APA family basic amino acid/polyamine antiporter